MWISSEWLCRRTVKVLFVLILSSLLSCTKEDAKEPRTQHAGSVAEDLVGQTLRMADLVTAHPAARLSSRSLIELEFSRALVPAHLVGLELAQVPIRFDPALEGKATWVSSSLLRFQPADPMPGGASFKGTLLGKQAFGEGVDVDDYSFEFAIAPQELLESSTDFAPDGSGLNRAQLEVTLRFAQPADSAALLKGLSLQREGRKHPLTLRKGGDSRSWVVVGGPVARTTQAIPFVLKLDGAFTAEAKVWTLEPILPAAGEFKVLSHGESSDPQSSDRTWSLRFSDPIATGRDLSGFVSITPTLEYTVVVRGKSLHLRGAFAAGISYNIQIESGLPSAFGPRLSSRWSQSVRVQHQKPKAEWLGSGVLVPTENNYRLQFRTINLAKVRLRVREVLPQNLGFFLQNNALRDAQRSSEYDDGDYDYYYGSGFSDVERVAKVLFENSYDLSAAASDRWHSTELDLSTLWASRPNSGFVVDLQFSQEDLPKEACPGEDEETWFGDEGSYYDDPCRHGYYYRNGNSQRFLISSSLTATAKNTAEGVHVWVTDVALAQPVSGLRLELSSYVNEVLSTVSTDRDGYAFFPKSDGVWIRGRNDRGLLLFKLNHRPWEISRFDVGGADAGEGGLRLYSWADRGVHRPGDTIHFAGLFREGAHPPPAGGAVRLRLRNPQGQEVLDEQLTLGAEGMFARSLPTDLQAPTGTWTALLSLGGREFQHALKVETVKPNRLKVELPLPPVLTSAQLPWRPELQARYLFGAPASDLRADVQLHLSPAAMQFPRYPEFLFSHPEASFAPTQREIFDQALDNQGRTQFDLQLPSLRGVPQAVGIRLQTRVHERGGGYTEHWSQTKLLPYPAWVGIGRAMNERWGKVGDTLRLPVVVLDSSGRAVSGRRVRVRWYANNRVRWWEVRRNGSAQFRTAQNTIPVGEVVVTSGVRPVDVPIFLEEEGVFLIEATDVQGGHESGMHLYCSQWGSSAPGSKRDPEAFHLEQTLNQVRYEVGDTLRVHFPAAPGARALVTLEQGKRLLRRQWVEASGSLTAASFVVDTSMVPNVHVVVSLQQPHKRQNDQPLRLYGIVPAPVEDPATRLDLSLKAPAEVRPGEEFTIEVQAGKKSGATYTLAVVDEGLLDLTGFRTPNPWNYFHRRLALGVETRDNLEDVVDALLPNMDGLFRIGGDEDGQDGRRGNPRARRFLPVALFTGLRTVKAGEVDQVRLRMPQYVGSVRIMMVGAAGRAMVTRDTTMPVRQPLMILPTVPRMARPGDQFDLPVSVFAMDKSVRRAQISLKLGGGLKVVGEASQTVEFAEPGEKDVKFRVEVLPQTGVGEIAVEARSGSEVVRESIQLPIQSANPLYTEVIDTLAQAGTVLSFTPKAFGIAGTNRARLVLTHAPPLQVEKRLNDLIRYPYGCVEQIVSAAFPQLYLESLLDLSPRQKEQISEHVKSVIERLPSYLSPEGGFHYWPAGNWSARSVADPWATTYAAHFLLEAKRLGYHVPQALMQSWQRYAKRRASAVQVGNHRYQTYLLYLLAKYGAPETGPMNLLRENHLGSMDVLSRRLLAAAFVLAKQGKVAAAIEAQPPPSMTSYREMAGTYGSSFRDQALMTLVAIDLDNPMQAARQYRQLAEDLRRGAWFSTQETAMALMALAAHAQRSEATGPVRFGVEGLPGITSQTTGRKPLVLDLDKAWDREIRLTPESGTLFAVLQIEGVPLENRIRNSQSGLAMVRHLYDAQGQTMQLSQVRQGEPFWVGYRLRSTTNQRLQGLALSSLFPAGWEIVNPRMSEEQPEWVRKFQQNRADYMDLRDDRVNWFFDLNAGGEAAFIIQVHPSFSGEYALPPVVLEAMYSPEYFARLEGGRASVQ